MPVPAIPDAGASPVPRHVANVRSDTRTVLGLTLSAVRNRPVEGTSSYGVFRL